jgi:hypothetical protein
MLWHGYEVLRVVIGGVNSLRIEEVWPVTLRESATVTCMSRGHVWEGSRFAESLLTALGVACRLATLCAGELALECRYSALGCFMLGILAVSCGRYDAVSKCCLSQAPEASFLRAL